MAFKTFYSKTDFLKLVHTGNTLGLRGAGAGPYSISVFTSLNPANNAGLGIPSSTDPLTNGGTTITPTQNGSWAELNPDPADVPIGSVVDSAALVWGFQGGFISPVNANQAITFIDATSIVHLISPNPTYSVGPVGTTFYTRVQDVTTIVQAAGFGRYAVQNVPNTPMGVGNGIGWSLIISYKHPSLPLRNVSIFVGYVNNGESTTVSGFYTPSSGVVNARAFVMALYGDSDAGGDSFRLNNVPLSGPRNPATNFFASQVCDYKGNLALISSFGDRNCTPGASPNLQRAEFDITNVDASGALGNGVTSTTVGIGAGGDVITANAVALEINANSAIVSIKKSTDKAFVNLGEEITYTLSITNTGSSDASNVVLFDTIPFNTTFVPNSIFLNGNNISGNIETGINIGSIPNTNGISTVTFKVSVGTGVPVPFTIPNTSYSTFDFISKPTDPTLSNSTISNTVETVVFRDLTTIAKFVNKVIVGENSTITYTLVVNNLTPVDLNKVIVIDTIPITTNFIPNSVIINGVSTPSVNPNTGITINTIPSGEVYTITFDVLSTTGTTIPNKFYTSYLYDNTIPRSLTSNTVNTEYIFLNIPLLKNTNKSFTTLGDEIEYTITIRNNSNIPLTNAIFKDTIPNGTAFVSNSSTLNGVSISENPETGITVGSLAINEIATITFKVLVLS